MQEKFPKTHDMLKAALAQTAHECGSLLGQQLEVRKTECLEVKRDAYVNSLENASFVVGMESQNEYEGAFHLVFTLRDAVTLSGTLLGIPAIRIQEKKRLAIIEADDLDAFSEIANQITGSFNTVFKQTLPRKVHLKLLPPEQFVPGEGTADGSGPFADGDYLQMRVHLSMAGQELEQVDLLMPLPLARQFDPQAARDEERRAGDSADAVPEGEAAVEEPAPNRRTVLILDDNEEQRQQLQEVLAASGADPVAAPLDADLGMLSRGGIQVVLLGVVHAGEQELSLCIKIKAHSREMSIPIIMCAEQWTRTGVLKALKNGARDILLKTSPPEELATRVMKLVSAA
jgi:CheY-like chemotaxis protein/chemotaxis protein CheY-P-specific phosphatase CheC